VWRNYSNLTCLHLQFNFFYSLPVYVISIGISCRPIWWWWIHKVQHCCHDWNKSFIQVQNCYHHQNNSFIHVQHCYHLDSDMSMSSTSGRLCQHVSLYWGSFVPVAFQCSDPWFSHWWRQLSSVVWTTVMRHWPVFLNISFDSFSQWWMQLLD